MRLLDLFEAKRHEEMLQFVYDLAEKYQSAGIPVGELDYALKVVPLRLKFANNTLIRDDRITWYLRLIKLSIIKFLKENAETHARAYGDNIPQEFLLYKSDIDNLWKKTVKSLSRFYPSEDAMIENANAVDNNVFSNQVAHFLGSNIPTIDEMRWTNQSPEYLLSTMEKLESEYNDNANDDERIINQDEVYAEGQLEVLIRFPDGSVWVDLHQASCEHEARAGGHCGNVPTARIGQHVLSYRIPVTKNGKRAGPNEKTPYYSPRLTFILDTNNGMLGEMKGRFNEKPEKKYHPYIIALLKLPIIKGIVGGGYEPEGNFSLDDLTDSERAELFKLKPEFLPLRDLFYSNDPSLKDIAVVRIKAIFDNSPSILYESINDETIVISRRLSINAITHNFTDAAKLAYAIEYGEAGNATDVDETDLLTAMDYYFSKYPKEANKFERYIRDLAKGYDGVGDINIADVSPENFDDHMALRVLEVAHDPDGITHQIYDIIEESYKDSVIMEMEEVLNDWLDRFGYLNFTNVGNNSYRVTSSISDFIALVDDGFLPTLEQFGWFVDPFNQDIDPPEYMEWGKLDYDDVTQRLHKQLMIPTPLSDIVKAKGKPLTSDRIDIERDLTRNFVDGGFSKYGGAIFSKFQEVDDAFIAIPFNWNYQMEKIRFDDMLRDMRDFANEQGITLIAKIPSRLELTNEMKELGQFYTVDDVRYIRFN